MIVGSILLCLFAFLGLYYIVLGRFSRWLLRGIGLLIAISIGSGMLGGASLPSLPILILAPILATNSFWRCLLWAVGRLREARALEAKKRSEAAKTRHVALSGPASEKDAVAGNASESPSSSSWVD